MRLIDADDILKILKEHAKSFIPNYEEDNYEAGVLEGLALAECEVNETPSVEERKHGHWEPFTNINRENTYRCSVCQNEVPHDLYGYYELTNYCPHCGAKMEEEAEK